MTPHKTNRKEVIEFILILLAAIILIALIQDDYCK